MFEFGTKCPPLAVISSSPVLFAHLRIFAPYLQSANQMLVLDTTTYRPSENPLLPYYTSCLSCQSFSETVVKSCLANYVQQHVPISAAKF